MDDVTCPRGRSRLPCRFVLGVVLVIDPLTALVLVFMDPSCSCSWR